MTTVLAAIRCTNATQTSAPTTATTATTKTRIVRTDAAAQQVWGDAEELADHILVHVEVVCAGGYQHRQRADACRGKTIQSNPRREGEKCDKNA
jgi:hypothetical protein